MSAASSGLVRPIPVMPWGPLTLTAAAITLGLLLAWEFGMRHLGLRAGDLDDGRAYWTVERRKVSDGPRDPVVIIGDSRILFDTDLPTWQALTGRRPIQLALMGTNAQPVLHDLAIDPHFAGLVVIGTAEFSYFSDDEGSRATVLDYMQSESPSQRFGHSLYRMASRHLAFLDSNYTLFTVLERHDWPERKGVAGPFLDVWKISESFDDRQSYLWHRIETDSRSREQSQRVWADLFRGPPVASAAVDQVIARTKADIDRIRARGGEVVWVRPPSDGPILDMERARYPRSQVWDRLAHGTGSMSVHFEDYPSMWRLQVPDWSHLSRASAVKFTDAYVSVLRERVEWLKVRSSDATTE